MLGPLAESSVVIPEPLAHSLVGEGAAALLTRLEGPPGLAAFDADGTLWDGDLGEAVLQMLIARREVRDDAWADYAHRVRRDPADGFAFAAQVMAGLFEARVRALSREVFAASFAFFPELSFLLRTLRARAWEIYVVSASKRFSIEEAVAAEGIDAAHVVGVDVEIERAAGEAGAQARLSDRVAQPVPTLEGKPALLRARTGRAADLAFGNSVLDLPLLRSAAIPVAVGALRRVGRPRNQFLAQAARRGWARLELSLPADSVS